jgi:N-methylhydantoinase A
VYEGNFALSYKLGIDIGGTFTDFALISSSGERFAIYKKLTTSDEPARAVMEGTRALLERESLTPADVTEIVHGTTLVTNAIIERRGVRVGMLVTSGFADVLEMREEKRYDVFDLRISFPPSVVQRSDRREITERVLYDGRVETPLDEEAVRAAVTSLVDAGIDALAIAFLHSYANNTHEVQARDIAQALYPELSISTSAEVFAGRREYERFTTTALNAYVQPLFSRYVEQLQREFGELGFNGRFYIMSSSGGTLAPATAARFPVRVVESGPAAGVKMSVVHGRRLELPDLLSFDMGGTTAKGALITGGDARKVYYLEVARQHDFKAGSGMPLRTPVIDMIEIGTGGGSLAHVDVRGTLRVGPRSAGANPGPACYGQGGTLPALTDANVLLGYLHPDHFLGGDMRLDVEAASDAMHREVATPLGVSVARAAFGVHDTINEDVARAFRIHASERGFDYRRCTMVAFGGSGPVHALSVARKLRIPRVVFPVAAGVMSAVGLLASPLAFEVTRTVETRLEDLTVELFARRFAELSQTACAPLLEAGLQEANITVSLRLDMRYVGQGHEIEVEVPSAQLADPPGVAGDVAFRKAVGDSFRLRYESLYAYNDLDAPLTIGNWKVSAEGPEPLLELGRSGSTGDASETPKPVRHQSVQFGDQRIDRTPVYSRYALQVGQHLLGPALIEERESTIVLGPDDRAFIDALENIVADLNA